MKRIDIAMLIKQNKDILLFLLLMIVFRSSFADINRVPTGSMKPTIVEGDRIIINKLAYDLQFPLTNTKLFKLADPERGDIVIFESSISKQRLVKRVIGVPGDVISMQNNHIIINDQRLSYQDSLSSTSKQYKDVQEDLLGTLHQIRIQNQQSHLSSFESLKVPDGYYLALGDNRDNSADSRVIGLVPRSEIIGRSRRVLLSLNPERFYLPRPSRFVKTL